MTKKSGNKSAKKATKQAGSSSELQGSAWIPYRTGIIIIAVLSIGMIAMTAYQAVTEFGMTWGEGLLRGLLFGGTLWIIFFGFILLNRLLGRH
jgi:hypothetical protein